MPEKEIIEILHNYSVDAPGELTGEVRHVPIINWANVAAEIEQLRDEWRVIERDGLPADNGDYFISDRDGEVWICYFGDGYFSANHDFNQDDILAWQNLPAAFKVKDSS
jgi:hypothetical protein